MVFRKEKHIKSNSQERGRKVWVIFFVLSSFRKKASQLSMSLFGNIDYNKDLVGVIQATSNEKLDLMHYTWFSIAVSHKPLIYFKKLFMKVSRLCRIKDRTIA